MLLTILLFHLSVLLAPSTPTAPIDRGGSSTLVGVVLDGDGLPLVGAKVFVADRRAKHSWPLESEVAHDPKDHPVRQATTDVEGRFRVTNLWPGPARAVFRGDGHATLRLGRVILSARNDTDIGSVQLTKSRVIKNSIVDKDGLAIVGAKLYSLPRREESRGFGVRTAAYETKSNPLGIFELSTLPLGEWTVLVEADGFATQRFEGVLLSDEPERRYDPFVLQAGVTLRGQVHSLANVTDLSKLVVRAIPAAELLEDKSTVDLAQGYVQTSVQGGGAFKFENLRPNTVYVLRAQQRTQSFRELDFWSPTAIVNSSDERARLEWFPSARVSFRALDVATGSIARDFELRLHGASPEEPKLTAPSSTAQGTQLIRNVRPTAPGNKVLLAAGGNGYREFQSRELTLVPGQLTQGGDVTLWAHPTVTLLVVDALTKLPIHRARIVLQEEESKPPPLLRFAGLTDVGGKLSINDSPGFPRRVSITASGYAPQVVISPFELVDDVLRVELEHGFDLTALVSNSDGDPLAGEGVRATFGKRANEHLFAGTDDAETVAYTDAEGVAWFHNLGSLEYEFLLAAWDPNVDVVVPQKVLPVKGPVQGIRFGIDPRTRIEGRVLEAGLPLSAAEVRVDGLRVRTNEEGRYILDPVDPKSRFISISHSSRATAHRDELRLDLSTNLIETDLPVTSIRGVVLDSKNLPVPGAAVYLASSRWQDTVKLSDAYDRNLFRVAAQDKREPVAVTDLTGQFQVNGVSEALGVTLSARTSDGFVGLERVRGVRPGSEITDVVIAVLPPSAVHVQPLNDRIGGSEHLALVATFAGEAQAGGWMRVLAPYTGQSWRLNDLPAGRWDFTLVRLSEFAKILETDRVGRQRLEPGEAFNLSLD